MKKLLTILLLFSALLTQAQSINMTIRDRFQRISVVDLYNGVNTTRYATVFIPSDWDASDTNSYALCAFLGDGSNGSWSDTTRDTPGHLMHPTATPNGRWNGKLIRNNGSVAKFAFIQLPYYGTSAQTAGSIDVYNALWRKFIVEIGLSLSTPDKRILGMALSGGPHRFVTTKQSTTDTANAYMQKIDRIVFMSPTNNASQTMSTFYWQNGRYRVFFSKGDPNTCCTPTYAKRLYDSLSRRGNNTVYLDSVNTGGHGSATWDSCMSVAGLNAPAGTGGDSSTNKWRWLIEDAAVSGNILPNANAGSDKNITLPTNSVTLNGSLSTDSDGTIVSYSWAKISGPSCTLNQPSNSVCNVVNMNTVGTYVFRLTVTDNDGGQDTDDVVAVVNDPGSIYLIRKKYHKAFIQ